MGIINLTPDSFLGDGLYKSTKGSKAESNIDTIKLELERIYKDFAKKNFQLVDIGAESTRPLGKPIGLEEEMRRVDLYLENINADLIKPFIHSVDTRRYEVIQRYIEYNSHIKANTFTIVNDVSGARDKNMINLIARNNLGIILNHRHPDSKTLHEKFKYQDPIGEVKSHLISQIDLLLNLGVDRNSIAIDPSLGFGKDQNVSYKILEDIEKLSFGYPIVLGFSNKKFSEAFKMSNLELSYYAFSKGVAIIRTHLSQQ